MDSNINNSLHDMEMRQVYCDCLVSSARRNRQICVLEADLMMSTGTKAFKEQYPNRFIDCGIAEQNMIGIAAGLSACGKTPFVHSFTPFVTRRCFDQIAVSVGYAKQNVKIVGTDPGIMATANGGTHMSFEDIALMKTVPNMIIFEPIDAVMLKKAMPVIIKTEQPMYIRLFRKKAKPVFGNGLKFDLFKANEIIYGKDVTIVAAGIMVAKALEAADILRKEHIYASIVAVHTYKPLDTETIFNSAIKTGAILTCENSFIEGGLGQAVAAAAMKEGINVPFDMIGVGDRYGEVGTEPYLSEILGLSVDEIVNRSRALIKKKKIVEPVTDVPEEFFVEKSSMLY